MAAVAAMTLASGLYSAALADPLPQSVRESPTADQFKDDINKYVADEIDHLKAGDKTTAIAREDLGRQPESTQTVTPSSSFQTMYVSAVVNNLSSVLTAKDVPLRLNGAIVVTRLCAATKAPQLADVAEQLMKDPAPAVALWGVKAGSTLLPTIMSVAFNLKNQKLTSTIVDAVKLHPNTGPIIQEAYNALSVGELNPPLPDPALQACIDAMNGIQAIRVKAWQADIPAAPQADRIPSIFFARGTINGAMTKTAKADAVQNQLSILSLASQRAAGATAAEQKKQFFDIASSCASSARVIMLRDSQSTAAQKLNDLIKLPSNLQPDQITQKISDAIDAVKAIPDYSNIAPVTTATPATAPAAS